MVCLAIDYMSKSDKKAIGAYMQFLERNGYENVERIKTPTDIRATKEGSNYYFEIKKTTQKKKYFGAATETEWAKAVEDPSKFKFVVVQEDDKNENKFYFYEYSLDDFRAFCSIPPFKIYFNIDIEDLKRDDSNTIDYAEKESGETLSKKLNNKDDDSNSKFSLNLRGDDDNSLFDAIHKVFNCYRNKTKNNC